MKRPRRRSQSAKSAKTVRDRNSSQSVFQNRSILPSVCGCWGRLLMWRMPCAAKLALELGLAAPRGVLAALVGEDLARAAVRGDAAVERLHHERPSADGGRARARR